MKKKNLFKANLMKDFKTIYLILRVWKNLKMKENREDLRKMLMLWLLKKVWMPFKTTNQQEEQWTLRLLEEEEEMQEMGMSEVELIINNRFLEQI